MSICICIVALKWPGVNVEPYMYQLLGLLASDDRVQ